MRNMILSLICHLDWNEKVVSLRQENSPVLTAFGPGHWLLPISNQTWLSLKLAGLRTVTPLSWVLTWL